MAGASRPRWSRGAAAMSLALLLAAALAAWLAPTAVGRGWIEGPAFAMRLGAYHLIARTTTRPECLPLTQHECFVSFPNPPSNAPAVYAVWAGRIERLPPAGSGPLVTISSGRPLLRIPVVRSP